MIQTPVAETTINARKVFDQINLNMDWKTQDYSLGRYELLIVRKHEGC